MTEQIIEHNGKRYRVVEELGPVRGLWGELKNVRIVKLEQEVSFRLKLKNQKIQICLQCIQFFQMEM